MCIKLVADLLTVLYTAPSKMNNSHLYSCGFFLFFLLTLGGKLPMTWYPQSYLAKVPMTNMAMRASGGYPGRTYRFYNGPVVFPYGFGLSYTTFTHSLAQAPTEISVSLAGRHASQNTTLSSNAVRVTHANCDSLSLGVNIDITNTGTMDGSHTLLVFSSPPVGKWTMHKQLVGFEKVHVVAGSKQRVQMHIHVCKHLSVVDQSGIRRIPIGEHSLHIGELKHSISLQATLGEIKL